MANFIQKFENQSAYDAAEHQYPNVSLVGTDIVYKMEAEFNGIIAKYDVKSTSEATTLLNLTTNITYQIIDGVRQDTVQARYSFDALGEHTVKYKLDGTSIYYYTFSGCSSLTSITIPSGVTSIGNNVFYDCSGLTSVTVEATTPPTLGNYVFADTNNCPIYVPAETVEAYKAATNWSEYASRIQAIP